MTNASRKSVFVLLGRHWAQEANKAGDTSIWGLSNPLDTTEGKQDKCVATAEKNLHDHHIVYWGSSPVLRARQTAVRMSEVSGVPVSFDNIKTHPELASPNFELEETIFAEQMAKKVPMNNALEIWQAMFDHSPAGGQLAVDVANMGYQCLVDVAKELHDGETAALFSHHPYVPWIVASATKNYESMIMVEKGGLVLLEFHFDGDVVESVDVKLLPMAELVLA